MSTSSHTHGFLAIAHEIAKRNGVELVIDTEVKGFVTDANRLRIPPVASLTNDYPKYADLEAYVVGGVTHDVGHILYTDRKARRSFVDSFMHHPAASLANVIGHVIEDVAVDRQVISESTDAEARLRALWSVLLRRLEAVFAADALTLSFQRYVLYRARCSVLNFPEMDAALQRAQTQFQVLAGTEAGTAVANACDRIDFVKSSAEGVEVAVAILQAFGISADDHLEKNAEEKGARQASSEQTQRNSCDQGADSDNQQASESKSDGPGESNSGNETDPSGHGFSDGAGEAGSATSSGPTKSEVDPSSNPTLNEHAAAESTQSDPPACGVADVEISSPLGNGDTTDIIAAAIEEINEQVPEGTEFVAVVGLKGTNDLAQAKVIAIPSAGQRLRSEVQALTTLATARLTHLLRVQSESNVTVGKKGKLIGAKAWKLKVGNFNIFRREEEGLDHSTAIEILLDRSTSMASIMREAVKAMAFVSLAVDSIEGISTSNHIFPGSSRAAVKLKDYGERLAEALDRMAGVVASGGTPMLAALRQVVPPLLAHPADRKILLVICDGLPHQAEVVVIAEMVKQLEETGVDVIAIGIGSETKKHLKTMFSRYACIDRVDDLTDALYEALRTSFSRQMAA